MSKKFWVHTEHDSVGVAVEDLAAGETLTGSYMDSGKDANVKSVTSIPLGHKIALRETKKGEKVLEYGEPIGVATQDIHVGDHVHTHNVKSLRWGKP